MYVNTIRFNQTTWDISLAWQSRVSSSHFIFYRCENCVWYIRQNIKAWLSIIMCILALFYSTLATIKGVIFIFMVARSDNAEKWVLKLMNCLTKWLICKTQRNMTIYISTRSSLLLVKLWNWKKHNLTCPKWMNTFTLPSTCRRMAGGDCLDSIKTELMK